MVIPERLTPYFAERYSTPLLATKLLSAVSRKLSARGTPVPFTIPNLEGISMSNFWTDVFGSLEVEGPNGVIKLIALLELELEVSEGQITRDLHLEGEYATAFNSFGNIWQFFGDDVSEINELKTSVRDQKAMRDRESKQQDSKLPEKPTNLTSIRNAPLNLSRFDFDSVGQVIDSLVKLTQSHPELSRAIVGRARELVLEARGRPFTPTIGYWDLPDPRSNSRAFWETAFRLSIYQYGGPIFVALLMSLPKFNKPALDLHIAGLIVSYSGN